MQRRQQVSNQQCAYKRKQQQRKHFSDNECDRHPDGGCTMGTNSGTTIAVNKLIKIVYVVTSSALPPSFFVMTADAVAVGHIMHIIAASNNTL